MPWANLLYMLLCGHGEGWLLILNNINTVMSKLLKQQRSSRVSDVRRETRVQYREDNKHIMTKKTPGL